jgi:hypothetical protein
LRPEWWDSTLVKRESTRKNLKKERESEIIIVIIIIKLAQPFSNQITN